ncbi:MAG: glycosyltransferase family 2 protein [Phycisphaeraceae bacterium]|nr:glycosyltransferase family 2 protein [Phycisphaeraceae bacterium]
MQQVGVVAIGRNEGARLETCLRSCVGKAAAVVYVDSGSSDGSVELARKLGAEVVELDATVPFTAARARNAGVQRLTELSGNITYVQLVDGDCELAAEWLKIAAQRLDENPKLAVVCGRRRERFPEASIYNRLIDMEWNAPIGIAKACGGDSMMRRSAFEQVGGFNPALICGEEPELCIRFRAAGFHIERLDAEMTLHDAAMTRLSQWWKRAVRSGWGFAEGAAMHGKAPQRHYVRQMRSTWFWGLIVPVIVIAAACLTRGWGLLLLLVYPVMIVRLTLAARKRGMTAKDAWAWALLCMLGKFPSMLGQVRYWLARLAGRRATLIEYKPACGSGGQ